MSENNKIEFSDDIKKLLAEKYPNVDIYNMPLDELKEFRETMEELREEYFMLELAQKQLGNAAYGACANQYFYFYNTRLAADITGECRTLTKFMWNRLEKFFHEDIWDRKDLWERFNFSLDLSKKEWYKNKVVSTYSDTDSVYSSYGDFFRCWTKEALETVPDRDAKINWILKFNTEFLDKQNEAWMDEIYTPRHAKSVHKFELETVSEATIVLKKKKYLKAMSYSKGKWFTPSKITGVGVELIKSTSPKMAKEIITDMTHSLVYECGNSDTQSYMLYFNSKLEKWKKKFWNAPIEDISQSIGIGQYKKYVIDDKDELVFAKKAPVSVKCAGRFNYLAHKNNEDNKRMLSGKIKYYNIRIGTGKKSEIDYFGYPSGELPKWAPECDKMTQWQKNVIEPLNRFLEAMNMPLVNSAGVMQFDLFGGA